MHWTSQYVGASWRAGAHGPESFDCWGLVWHVALHHYNVDLPRYPVSEKEWSKSICRNLLTDHELSPPNNEEFENLDGPEDGAVVLLSRHQAYFDHVGIYVKTTDTNGVILHATINDGVMAETMPTLRMRGFSRFVFYRKAQK